METPSRRTQVTRTNRQLTFSEQAAVFRAVAHGDVPLAATDAVDLHLAIMMISNPSEHSRREELAATLFRFRGGGLEWITA